MLIAVYAVALIVYLICPKYLKLVLLLINMFIPDAVPVVDELIMVAGLLVGD